MTEVLVDTSAWVEFLRGRGNRLGDVVEEMIIRDEVAMTGPVIAELYGGVRGRRETRMVDNLLAITSYHDVVRVDWAAAGAALNALSRRGITVPKSDAVIAAVARRLRIPVLTVDHHFEHLGVKLYEF
jgi:predicted nucleic acid-binding protein